MAPAARGGPGERRVPGASPGIARALAASGAAPLAGAAARAAGAERVGSLPLLGARLSSPVISGQTGNQGIFGVGGDL